MGGGRRAARYIYDGGGQVRAVDPPGAIPGDGDPCIRRAGPFPVPPRSMRPAASATWRPRASQFRPRCRYLLHASSSSDISPSANEAESGFILCER